MLVRVSRRDLPEDAIDGVADPALLLPLTAVRGVAVREGVLVAVR